MRHACQVYARALSSVVAVGSLIRRHLGRICTMMRRPNKILGEKADQIPRVLVIVTAVGQGHQAEGDAGEGKCID